MVLLLLTFCLLLLPLWESVIVLCFVVRYFMSILVLQSSWWGRESWLLCLICLPGVSWWLSGSSSRCHGVVCSLWLWYFLIILTYYFWPPLAKLSGSTHAYSNWTYSMLKVRKKAKSRNQYNQNMKPVLNPTLLFSVHFPGCTSI